MMAGSSEDSFFVQFQEKHDVRALSKVFDRTAPILWRLGAQVRVDDTTKQQT